MSDDDDHPPVVQLSAVPSSFVRFRMTRSSHPCDHKNYADFTAYTGRLQMIEALGETCVGLSEHLMDLGPGTEDRQFQFVNSTFRVFGLLPKRVVSTEASRRELFDRKLALSVRYTGNERFREADYGGALDRYTESMIISEPGTMDYALALANRSAALYHMKEYRLCIDDVRRALRSTYPRQAAYKLVERAANAERMLGNYQKAINDYDKCLKLADKSQLLRPNLIPCITDGEKLQLESRVANAVQQCKDFLKRGEEPCPDRPFERRFPVHHLLGGKNEKIPAFSKYLELKPKDHENNMPRGVYATCDINPGDVVAIDNPYICGPSSYYNSVCHYAGCMKMSIAVIPCMKCSLAYYCNEECIRNDLEDGHNILCPIMFSLVKIPGQSNLNILSLKWLLKEIKILGFKKYCSVLNKLEKTKVDPVNEGFDENGQFKSDNFLSAYSMRKYRRRTSIDVILFLHCIAVDMLEYLRLSGFEIPKPYLNTVGASLVNMLLIVDANCGKMFLHNPSITNQTYPGIISPIANALYPSLGLFNHSCDPNVRRCGIMSDKTRVLKAIQPIPKGSQLFISYGVCFKKEGKNVRFSYLRENFKFKCSCQPCLENWPINRFIPDRLSLLNLLNPKMADIISLECKKFLAFKKTTVPDDFHKHLNYLYSFNKLISANVKRPFKLYEDCLDMLIIAHTYSRNSDQKFISKFFQSDRHFFQPDSDFFEDV